MELIPKLEGNVRTILESISQLQGFVQNNKNVLTLENIKSIQEDLKGLKENLGIAEKNLKEIQDLKDIEIKRIESINENYEKLLAEMDSFENHIE